MKSSGKLKGFKCKKCKTKKNSKVKICLQRNIETGYYEVTPGSRRHLSKPLIRMNNKKNTIIHPLK